MSTYDWKISRVNSERFGHIRVWDDDGVIHIYVDPCDADGTLTRMVEHKRCGGKVYNDADVFIDAYHTEVFDCDGCTYRRIESYWRSLGSPTIESNPPGYQAPWFPWADAGFTPADVADILAAVGMHCTDSPTGVGPSSVSDAPLECSEREVQADADGATRDITEDTSHGH